MMPAANPARPIHRSKVDEVLRGVSRLRPLPSSATRILNALDSQSSTAGMVAELIALDQAITAYILRVANSASLGYGTNCSSINDAVMRLGFKQVRSLVISMTASGPLSSRLSGYRQGDKELWFHSIATASASHWLAGVLRYPAPEEAYVAGLLHDIGKLLLDQFVMVDYPQIITTIQRHHKPLWQVEQELFGIDHAAVGGLIATRWEFPAPLVAAIQFHHVPAQAEKYRGLAAIVNLANALVPQENPSELTRLEGREVTPGTLEILHVEPLMLERLKTRLAEALFEYQSRQPSL